LACGSYLLPIGNSAVLELDASELPMNEAYTPLVCSPPPVEHRYPPEGLQVLVLTSDRRNTNEDLTVTE